MLLTSPVDLLMPTPLHLLAVLVACTVLAFRRASRWRHALLAASAWCWIMATPALAHGLAVWLEQQHPPFDAQEHAIHDPVILVLASGEYFERTSPDPLQLDLQSFRRTQAALEVWRVTGGTLLFSGAARHEAIPVAARMAKLAAQAGVPSHAIRVEAQSHSTRENLANSRAMIEPGRQVILVTSAMHMPRAMAVAHALGMQPLAAPGDHRGRRQLTWRAWLPNSDALPLLGLVLHECFGRAYYAARGWT